MAHGLAIAVMVSATAATSGGHLNPAVTCAALVAGKISAPNAALYIAAQLAGAVVAAFVVKLAVPAAWLAAVGMGNPGLGAGVTVGQALVMEIVLTFFLMFVVYGTAINVSGHEIIRSQATVKDLLISGVRDNGEIVAAIRVDDSDLEVERFHISAVPGYGAFLDEDANVDLREGTFSNNRVGLRVATPGYDLRRVLERVVLVNNLTAIEAVGRE